MFIFKFHIYFHLMAFLAFLLFSLHSWSLAFFLKSFFSKQYPFTMSLGEHLLEANYVKLIHFLLKTNVSKTSGQSTCCSIEGGFLVFVFFLSDLKNVPCSFLLFYMLSHQCLKTASPLSSYFFLAEIPITNLVGFIFPLLWVSKHFL